MKLSRKSTTILVVSIVVAVLLIDQVMKVWVKLNFTLGEAIPVFSWFSICFVENDGMAFGIEWFDKLFLTIFRIVAIGFVAWYIHRLIAAGARTAFVLMVSLVLAGAAGNLIDCIFYGVLFSESTPFSLATFLPEAGGYAPLFYGKVVDMLYFPLITNAAGETVFFRPVFNFADSCITVSVIVILLFFSKDLNRSLSSEKNDKTKDTQKNSESDADHPATANDNQ